DRGFAEGEGDRRAVVAVAQRAVDDVDDQRRVLGVDGDVVAAGAAEVEGDVGVAAGRDRDRAGAGEVVVGREGGGVDQRVGGDGQAADDAAGCRNVAGVKADRGFAEGEGDRRAVVAVAQRAVDDVDDQRRVLGVDGDVVAAGAAEVEGDVGVAAGRDRDRAGAGEVVVGREGGGVDQRVGGDGQAADDAAGCRNVAGVKADRGFAEGEGDRRAVVAVAQRAVDDVDDQRRVLGVDGGVVAAGATEAEGDVGVAAGRDRDRAGAGEVVVGREGGGVDQRVGGDGQAADDAA